MGRAHNPAKTTTPAARRVVGSPRFAADLSAAALAAHADRLAADVRAAHADQDAYRAWLHDDHKPLTAYRQATVAEVLAQRPDATRVGGQRAWANRGRRVKAGAQPLFITTRSVRVQYLMPGGRRAWPDALQSCMGPDAKPAPLRARHQLQELLGPDWRQQLAAMEFRELEPARTQTVYDITDTEPVREVPLSDEQRGRANAAIGLVLRAAAANNIEVVRGNDSPDAHSPAGRHAHEYLLRCRDSGGVSMTVNYRDGRQLRYIAAPGGLNERDELRVLAHELGHFLLGHQDQHATLRRLRGEDHEVQAEAFAALLADAHDVRCADSAPYIVNHACGRAKRDPVPVLERNLPVVLGALRALAART